MPAIMELNDPSAALEAREGVLYRMTIPCEVQTMDKPQEDTETGDVTFWARGVDKNKAPNRRGFIFDWDKPSDVKLANFLKNPVMPYRHDESSLPIGRWEKVEVTDKSLRLFGRIPGGPDYEALRLIRAYIRDQYLKAVSIGFYILKWEEVKDEKTGQVLAICIKSFELVECSPCPVGAHESAIIGQDMPDLSASARIAIGDFCRPPKARWTEQDLYDVKQGGPRGRLFRLALDEQSSDAETPKESPELSQDAAGDDLSPERGSEQPHAAVPPAAPIPPPSGGEGVEAKLDSLSALMSELTALVRQTSTGQARSAPATEAPPAAAPTPQAKSLAAEAAQTPAPSSIEEQLRLLEPVIRGLVRTTLEAHPDVIRRSQLAAAAAATASGRTQAARRFNTHA